MSSEIKRLGDDYSITSKLVDYVGNPDWRAGYNELLTNGDNTVGNGLLWDTISSSCETIASDIYSKVYNFTSNISDIDTCEVHTLKSYTDMVGYFGNTSYLDYTFPTELTELVNIFSIKKDLLLKTGKILDITTRSNIFSNVKSTYYNNSVMDGYNTENAPSEIRIDDAGSSEANRNYIKSSDINGYNHWVNGEYDIYNNKISWVNTKDDKSVDLYKLDTAEYSHITGVSDTFEVSGRYVDWVYSNGEYVFGTTKNSPYPIHTFSVSGDGSLSGVSVLTNKPYGDVFGRDNLLFATSGPRIESLTINTSGGLDFVEWNYYADNYPIYITGDDRFLYTADDESPYFSIYTYTNDISGGMVGVNSVVVDLGIILDDPTSLWANGGFTYCGTENGYIAICETDDSGTISVVNNFNSHYTSETVEYQPQSIIAIHGFDGIIYAVGDAGTIYTIKINVDGTPTLLYRNDIQDYEINDICYINDYIYVASNIGMVTYYMDNNGKLTEINSTTTAGDAVSIYTDGRFIYTLDQVGFISTHSQIINNISSYPDKNGWIAVSGDTPLPKLTYFDQFSDSELEYIDVVSKNPIEYTYITDDDEYTQYIEDCFYDLLSKNIYTEYREYEIGQQVNLDSDQTTYNPSIASNSTKSGYVWKNIINDLSSSKLFRDINSGDEKINEAKIQYGIDTWFPEKKYVDQINAGIYKLSDFSTTEQIILQLEMTRRSNERDVKLGVSRYYVERENKVKDYFRFIELFNRSTESGDVVDYSIDDSKFEITGSDIYILTEDGASTVVNDDAIRTTAKKLRNLVIKTSYLRDVLKTQAQKYYINGTESLLTDLINDYFERYVYNTEDFWRYDTTTETGKLPAISKLDDFNIDIIEYIDPTEYMNVSASNDPTSADVNGRYWETFEPTDGTAFDSTDIEDFYKNEVGIDFNVAASGDSTTYSEHLSSFLDIVFNSGATSATSSDIYTTSTVTSTVDTGIYYFDQLDATPSGTVDKYPLSDDIFKVGYGDYTSSNGLPNEGWIKYNSAYFIDIQSVDGGNALRIDPNTAADTGYLPLSSVLQDELEPNSDYLIEIEIYTENLNSSTIQRNNYFSIYDGNIENHFGCNTLRLTWQKFYYKFTTSNNPVSCYLKAKNNETSDAYDIYLRSAKLYKFGTPSTESQNWFIPSESLTLSSYTTSASITTLVDNGDAYFKYIGTPSGYTPYANIKNQIHPSYMPHPFMKSFVEYVIESNPIENIFNYETNTYEVDYQTVSDRIDNYGNLVNYWWDENIDFSGYRTNYESSLNIGETGSKSALVDYDSPFYYQALVDLYDDPYTFINSVQTRTGDVYENYYSHLSLSSAEALKIATQLNYITFTTTAPLNVISSKNIYKYVVDQYGNSYSLYKDEDSFDTLGEVWVKLKDHPIAFPIFVFNGLEVNDRNQTLSQLPIGTHNSLGDLLIDSSTGLLNVYDIGFNSQWLYFIFKDPDQPTSNSTYSNVMFGKTTTELSDDGYSVFGFEKDTIHNFETHPFTVNSKYIGTYVKNSTFTSIFADVNSNGNMSEDDRSAGYTQFLCDLSVLNFDPVNGISTTKLNIPTKYQTLNTTNHNEWLLTSNGSDQVSISFESVKLPILTDLEHSVVDYINSDGDLGLNTYNNLLTIDNLPTLYDNGFTCIDLNVDGVNYPSSKSTSNVTYFYKNSEIDYLSIYPNLTHVNRLWESEVLGGSDEYKLQFFGEPIGVNESFAYEGNQSIFNVEYPYTSVSAFQAFDPISGVPSLSAVSGDLYHGLEGNLFIEPTLSAESFGDTNIGIFELINGDPLSCYYEVSGDVVQQFYFKSGLDFKTIINTGDSVLLSSAVSGSDNYYITLDDKNKAKFTIS